MVVYHLCDRCCIWMIRIRRAIQLALLNAVAVGDGGLDLMMIDLVIVVAIAIVNVIVIVTVIVIGVVDRPLPLTDRICVADRVTNGAALQTHYRPPSKMNRSHPRISQSIYAATDSCVSHSTG